MVRLEDDACRGVGKGAGVPLAGAVVVKKKSERRALVDKGAPKTYGKLRAAPDSRSKGEGFYEL